MSRNLERTGDPSRTWIAAWCLAGALASAVALIGPTERSASLPQLQAAIDASVAASRDALESRPTIGPTAVAADIRLRRDGEGIGFDARLSALAPALHAWGAAHVPDTREIVPVAARGTIYPISVERADPRWGDAIHGTDTALAAEAATHSVSVTDGGLPDWLARDAVGGAVSAHFASAVRSTALAGGSPQDEIRSVSVRDGRLVLEVGGLPPHVRIAFAVIAGAMFLAAFAGSPGTSFRCRTSVRYGRRLA